MRTEASLLISPSDFKLGGTLDDNTQNHQFYLKIKLASCKVIREWENSKLLLVESNFQVMLLDVENELIRYYVKYKISSSKGVKFITQIALWAITDRKYTLPNVDGEPLIKWTFFNYLLPKAKAIAADTMQTPAGMAFWFKRIRDAIDGGLQVVALLKDKNMAIRITSLIDLRKIESEIWGELPKHEYRRAIIAKDNLFPNAKTIEEYLK